MENFGEKLLHDIQVKLLHDIQKTELIKLEYGNRYSVPQDIVKEAFSTIDKDKIIRVVRENIEEQIAKTIVGQLLTETATDTKQLMSDNATRQKMKYLVYPNILKMLEAQND